MFRFNFSGRTQKLLTCVRTQRLYLKKKKRPKHKEVVQIGQEGKTAAVMAVVYEEEKLCLSS